MMIFLAVAQGLFIGVTIVTVASLAGLIFVGSFRPSGSKMKELANGVILGLTLSFLAMSSFAYANHMGVLQEELISLHETVTRSEALKKVLEDGEAVLIHFD